MKKLIISTGMLLFCTGLIKCTEFIGSQLPQNFISQTVAQIPEFEIISSANLERSEPTFEDLCKTITFTRSGLTCYFKHIYNCDNYAQDVLPLVPFKHMSEFLVHGINTNQPSLYTKAVFKLFDNKLKATPSISATEFLTFLQQLPNLIQKDLSTSTNKKNDIKQLIRAELENNFDVLKANPEMFLNSLSQKIVDLDSLAQYASQEHLCFTIMRFIDTCLGKIIWLAADKDEVWKNFLAIGQELTTLHEKGIIKIADDLDDCQWALATRFCFFLSLSGSQLPLSFYEQARLDIHKGIKHFDTLAEQEELITTKTHYLQDAIIASTAKADARQQFGILSEDIIN